MNDNKLDLFEKKLLSGIIGAVGGIGNARIGVAVSGGADSVSLLLGLYFLSNHFLVDNVCFSIYPITVNHNLRSDAETSGDAEFVESLCNKLSLPCARIDVPRGEILELASSLKCGVEAAARIVRYRVFENHIEKNNLDYLALAHNKNDQVETVLMRFFQGSGTGELSGIPNTRGKFIRPLLDVSRDEIESYLERKNQDFRTDCTNFDTSMKRNLLRNRVIPFLDDNLEGWQKGVINLSRKTSEDEDFIHRCVEDAFFNCSLKVSKKSVLLDLRKFTNLHVSLQRRILYRCFDALGGGCNVRIPFSFIDEIMKKCNSGGVFSDVASDFEVRSDGKVLLFQKNVAVATESSFFVIIEEDGCYEAGFWKILSRKNEDGRGINLILSYEESDFSSFEVFVESAQYPFAFRSRQPADSIKTATGSEKSIVKILKDWKAEGMKDVIPLIQNLGTSGQEIVGIIGQGFGFKNWIVNP